MSLSLAAAGDAVRAQAWSAPFNHNGNFNGNDRYTHPYSPWHTLVPGGAMGAPPANLTWAPGEVGGEIDNVDDGNGGSVFLAPYTWPQPSWTGAPSFNAVHMAVIPKGPYRGMVLVWNVNHVLGRVNPLGTPALNPGEYQSFQAYAVIDPADEPPADIRFRNFLVPIGDLLTVGPLPLLIGKDLFCSGHAWSPYGDLIVVGGTDFVENGGILYAAGKLTYVFNPRLPCYWPGLTTPVQYYPTLGTTAQDYVGMWVRGPDLDLPRWYPTATLTHGLVRGSLQGSGATDLERMMVFGGSQRIPAQPNDASNLSYEAFVIEGEAAPNLSNLSKDEAFGLYGPGSPTVVSRVWNGPGIAGSAHVDWLGEYPRCHLLSNGTIWMSGYVPRWSVLDHESPGAWLQSLGQSGAPLTYSSNWPHERHDGSAVLFPNFGGNADIVLRVGGSDGLNGPTTATTESISTATGNDWVAALNMPTTDNLADGGRTNMNLVILPTGALLALGGIQQPGPNGLKDAFSPLLFENGKRTVLPPNPAVSRRGYHSAAVLLPDGRVFLGGGDDREWDYEIFSPEYMQRLQDRPRTVRWLPPVPGVHPDMGAYELHYDNRYSITCAELPLGHAISKVVLTAPCSVTHHSDMHQRYVEMTTLVQNGNEVQFHTPLSEPEAPRGIYLLWLVTSSGAVSEAEWVVLR